MRNGFVAIAIAATVLCAGCASNMTRVVPAADMQLSEGKAVEVFTREPAIQLPTSGGQLSIYAPGEARWYLCTVRGMIGYPIIGRIDADFGIPYPLRYTSSDGHVTEMKLIKRPARH